ncbi:hypothetical protein AB1Y20_000652 [Prymnesium parvum]|uniref:U-box domain-containing protein n=1 Tax=Prymnesium parvum TaxID=97485 RepID=A0AB34K778_PRYPA|mmetsp:Transcript_32274/g.80376  ORF Transcript_32274/g.80376 Transcript_32274/m.80376 type:complete len:368 (+) Transcript_32274:356-1459(+)
MGASGDDVSHPLVQDGNYHPLHWASYKSDHAECAQLLVEAGADISVRTKRGFTPLEIARGQNNVVSSKPGVAAVLEQAQALRRTSSLAPFRMVGSVGEQSQHGIEAVCSSRPASDAVLPVRQTSSIFPSSTAASNSPPARGGQAWSPLASAQAAAEAAQGAAVAVSATHRVDLVRDERAAMERAVVTAQRDAERRAAEEQERVDAKERAKVAEAMVKEEDVRQRRNRRARTSRIILCAFLSISAAGLAASTRSLLGVLVLTLAISLLFIPYSWLPSAHQWRVARRGMLALVSQKQPWPPQLMCPITGELMEDPVTIADGHTFERAAIERWLQSHDTSPMTGIALPHTQLAPAIALRQLIQEAKEGRA